MAEPVKNCYGAPVPSSLKGCTEMPQQKNEVTIVGEKSAKQAEFVDVQLCRDVYFTETGTLGSKAKTEFTYCSTFKVRADSKLGKEELARRAAEEEKQAEAAQKPVDTADKKEAKKEVEVDQKQKSLQEQEKKSIPVSAGWHSVM